MIFVLKSDATDSQVEAILEKLRSRALEGRLIRGSERSVVAVIGAVRPDLTDLADLPGVDHCARISRPYKLASREVHPDSTVVPVGGITIGGPHIVVMAGPCSVESRENLLEAARACRDAGATILRAGAFKPRTSPYAFQGLGLEGLKILAEAREMLGMPIVTEVVAPSHMDMVAEYADIVQIGARNMQNFELLRVASEIRKPVLLKRGIAATIDEWLQAAEYILAGGNPHVILCERGIRTYETATRNTLDLSAIPVLRALTHLPVVVDPSHGTGHRSYASPMALAAIAAGADGIMVEVHPDPPQALSDGPQSLYPDQLVQLIRDLEVIAPVVGRQVDRPHRRGLIQVSPRTAADTTEGADGTGRVRVAYQGQPGAFSQRAAGHFFGADVETSGCLGFRDVFEAVRGGQASFGVLPLENSLTGSIHENYDLLLEHNLHIVGEIKLRIVHALITLPGVTMADVRRVYAHFQAAAQCEEYLRRHPEWEVVSVYDTAGSVLHVKEHGFRDGAAIASPEAASLYGMQVLEEGIESHPRNFTRFIVVSHDAGGDERADKTSVVFATPNRPGALEAVLAAIARLGVNMTKLESRPIQGQPWEYMFYADLQAVPGSASWDELLAALQSVTRSLRILGSYASA